MSSHRIGWIAAYVVIPVAVGLATISMVFRSGDLLPIEEGDDGVHTYIESRMVLAHALRGELLKINLYSNFGTPTLGEPVLCPFAPHAVTYQLMGPAHAMVANKFLLAALSVAALTAFFALHLPLAIASLAAVLTFSEASFFYFFQNHPHQGTLLYYTLALLAVRRMTQHDTARSASLVLAAFLAFVLGVGVNGVLFGIGFIVLYAVIRCAPQWRLLARVLALLAAAALVVHAHYVEFFRLAKRSARLDVSYLRSHMDPDGVWRSMLFFNEDRIWSSTAVFFSWPVVVLAAFGFLWLAWKLKTRKVVVLAFALGLLPFLAVYFLLTHLAFLDALPGLRSVNVIRLLWFTSPFLMLAFGFGLREAARLPVLRTKPGTVVLALALLALLAPRYRAFRMLADMCQGTAAQFDVPPALTLAMTPNTRMAFAGDPENDIFDFLCARQGVLGSGGRSIIMDGGLKHYLLDRDMIVQAHEGMLYLFKPLPPEFLARLGIRWFASGDDTAGTMGWRLHSRPDDWHLFENPWPVTPIYVDDRATGTPLFIDTFELDANEVRVTLPPSRPDGDVVVTFVAQPPWKAFADGAPIPVQVGKDRMIRLSVDRAVRSLRLVYEPFSDLYLWASLLAGILLARAVAWPGRRAQSAGIV